MENQEEGDLTFCRQSKIAIVTTTSEIPMIQPHNFQKTAIDAKKTCLAPIMIDCPPVLNDEYRYLDCVFKENEKIYVFALYEGGKVLGYFGMPFILFEHLGRLEKKIFVRLFENYFFMHVVGNENYPHNVRQAFGRLLPQTADMLANFCMHVCSLLPIDKIDMYGGLTLDMPYDAYLRALEIKSSCERVVFVEGD